MLKKLLSVAFPVPFALLSPSLFTRLFIADVTSFSLENAEAAEIFAHVSSILVGDRACGRRAGQLRLDDSLTKVSNSTSSCEAKILFFLAAIDIVNTHGKNLNANA